MASTVTSDSIVYSRRVDGIHKYHWPAIQLNVWMLVMLISACTIVGVFGSFINTQQILLLPIPWYAKSYIFSSLSLCAFFFATSSLECMSQNTHR